MNSRGNVWEGVIRLVSPYAVHQGQLVDNAVLARTPVGCSVQIARPIHDQMGTAAGCAARNGEVADDGLRPSAIRECQLEHSAVPSVRRGSTVQRSTIFLAAPK